MAVPGDTVLVRYNLPGALVWHERIILCVSPHGEFGVLDPDLDVFGEDYSAHNPALVSVLPTEGVGDVPATVPAGAVYGFNYPLPTEAEISSVVRQAALMTGSPLPNLPITVKIGTGFGGPAGAAALPNIATPLPPLAVQVAPAGGVWVLDEPTVSHEIGDPFTLPTGALRFIGQTRAMVMIAGSPTTLKFLDAGTNIAEYARARAGFLGIDRRTLEVPATDDNQSIAALLQVSEYKAGGLPSGMLGNPTAGWVCDQVAATGSGFVQRHHTWRAQSGVPAHLPMVFEHEVLSTALDLAISVDRLNVRNLASFEWLLRRVQLHENAVLENPAAPSYEGARHFMGKGNRRGGALVAPELTTYVAAELGKEAAILREKRKAREAKLATKDTKGKGKGGAPGDPPAKS